MLSFNGSEFPNSFGLLGVQVSSPAVTARTLDVPGVYGLIRNGVKLGNRSVTIRAVNLGDTIAARAANMAVLNAWAYSSEPKALYLPGRTDRYLLAECSAYPTTDEGAPGDEVQLTFAAYRPEFISASESSHAAGVFTIGGGIPTPIRMEQTLTADATNPTWVIDSGAHTIMLSGTVPAGALIIDTDKGLVTLDGDDITDTVSLASDINFTLAPGAHTIVGTNGADGTICWRVRWL